jgi:hypothetical protein
VTGPPAPRRVPLPAAPPGYELIGELGVGGMGAVYLAREVVPDRLVAMKFLRRPGSQSAYDRFLVEVRALALLDHPHIIRVLSTDFFRSDPYFTTEYFSGGSLLKKVEEAGPLDPAEAARLIAAVARAVHAANERDVIHRDLKPSNILLAEDGSPRIADFGLAKRLDRDDDLTTSTGPLGSPPYMAPEQTGRLPVGEVDARTDVYALGATLYHLVTGRRPFAGNTPDEVIAQVLSDTPPTPRSVRPGLPPDLEAIVLKCLEKDPGRRYASAEALADDLDRFLAGGSVEAPRLTSWRRAMRCTGRTRRLLTRLGLGLTAGCVIAAAATVRDCEGPPPSTGDAPRPPAVVLWQPAPAVPAVLPQFTPVLTPEQVGDELRAGKSVLLVDDAAPRVPLAWGLGSCDVLNSRSGDTRFSLRSRSAAVLHLLTEPGVDHYRVRLEVRQDLWTPVAGPGSAARVGVVLGHARVRAGADGVAHSLVLVGFNDHPAAPAKLELCDIVLLEQPLRSPLIRQHTGRTIPLAGRGEDQPPWRVLEIDVGPGGVTVHHGGRSMACSAAEIRDLLAHRQAELGNALPDAGDLVVPPWNPRLPLGIWAFESWVSVRNVTVEPVP